MTSKNAKIRNGGMNFGDSSWLLLRSFPSKLLGVVSPAAGLSLGPVLVDDGDETTANSGWYGGSMRKKKKRKRKEKNEKGERRRNSVRACDGFLNSQ